VRPIALAPLMTLRVDFGEGLRHATAEVAARLAAGEELPADAYYFRSAIRLATAAPRLAFLNERLALSHGRRLARSVELSVHSVR
jgi:Protein of unknown function (DUF3237)